MSRQARNYSDIALAVESILAGFNNPEVATVTIDPWEISLRTVAPLPGVDYETSIHNDYIIRRGEIQYGDLTIELSHVEQGKVVPNERH